MPSNLSRILSYGSVVLYDDDLLLLQDGEWLNDRLITFATEYLMDQLNSDEREQVEVLCPSTCEMLKFSPDAMTWLSDYANRPLVIFVVNNNEDPSKPGGSHWSLLVFVREDCQFYYMDSLTNADSSAAIQIMNNASRHLCPGEKPRLHKTVCPRQENCYDCGLLVIEFVRFILTHGLHSPTKALKMLAETRMDASFIRECRSNWKNIILEQARIHRLEKHN